VDGARFAKAHLGLLRVDVDVDQPRIEVQPQRIGGLAILMQHVAIGLAQRVREHAVADEAAVDERILSARRCRVRRPHREARQRQRAGAGIDDGGALDEGVAQQRLDAGAPPLRQQPVDDPAVVLQREADVGVREGDAPERLVEGADLPEPNSPR
jgi:hypothetical protein